MKLSLLSAIVLAGGALAQQAADSPTGNRTTPPTIATVAPQGAARGATITFTVEGFNLANASAVYFSQPGITAKIVRIKELPDLPDIRLGSNGTLSTVDLGPLPPRNQVTLDMDIGPEAPVGPVSFRLLTPLGTSPEGKFLVEPYYGESPDREPNDTPETAFESYLPTILVGTIAKPGDIDFYRIEVKAGDQLVLEDGARMLGSALRPIIGIYTSDLALVKEFGNDGVIQPAFAHRFEKAGVYYLRVSDYQQSGGGGHFYRIKAGKFPYVLSAYPLGVPRNRESEVKLTGFNVGEGAIRFAAKPASEGDPTLQFRPALKAGMAFNEINVALGDLPAVESNRANASLASAQSVPLPVTVNGRLAQKTNQFRFRAKKGEKIVIDVIANRLGSELDSLIEVLDLQGIPIERSVARCVLETSVTLRDHESVSPGVRLQSPSGFAVGDWVMLAGEILRIEAMPRTPDDDFRFEQFGGQRIGFFDTTPEAHAVDSAAYKVQILPAGSRPVPNGLPIVRLTHRNDDGGPGYGKDSRLRFTAPADGEYIVRLQDVRGSFGDPYTYQLNLRDASPDFQLTVSPRNPNVPSGGRIPLTVTALRGDDFDGPIEVTVADLPAGLTATRASILPGQVSTVLLLSAVAEASLKDSVPLKVTGTGAGLTRHASPDDPLKLISVMPKPDIVMHAETKEVTLEPGGTAEVKVKISRNNEFGGRVPVIVGNLPPGVRVLDVGLNGVLINETETERSFTLEALTSAQPVEQNLVVSGNIETRAGGQQTLYAAEPIRLKVTPRKQMSAAR